MSEGKTFKINKDPSLSKTIRMPESLINNLQQIANLNDISFNQVVVQCCEFAIENSAYKS